MKVDITKAASEMVQKGQAFTPPTAATAPFIPAALKSAPITDQEQRVLVQIRVPKSLHRQLKQMALDGDTSIQELMENWIREKL